jgi:hypothetical protein
MFGKLRDYLIRVDDPILYRRCPRTFEMPSHQSLVFI